ncbi:MAG: peptidylprolyl isomerase [Pseudomonadota bacterium]
MPRFIALIALNAMLMSLVLSPATLPSHANAQDLFAVVTKVNDAAITGYDVQQRSRLVAIENPNFNADQRITAALQSLIEDELKLQEAQRRGLEVTEEQVDQSLASIAQRNGKTADALLSDLSNAGVGPETYRKRLKAETAWNRLLRSRYRERATPTDAEIDAAMSDAQQQTSEVRYDVRQIVVDLRARAPRAEVQAAVAKATEVRKQMTSCDVLEDLGKQHSRLSGKVGELTPAQMPRPVREAVVNLPIGGVTEPLRSQDGLHLIMVCAKGSQESSARRGQIYERLLNEKIQGYSENYLDDLRREAVIESRS